MEGLLALSFLGGAAVPPLLCSCWPSIGTGQATRDHSSLNLQETLLLKGSHLVPGLPAPSPLSREPRCYPTMQRGCCHRKCHASSVPCCCAQQSVVPGVCHGWSLVLHYVWELDIWSAWRLCCWLSLGEAGAR